jgi:nucleoid-associated protein YgaU
MKALDDISGADLRRSIYITGGIVAVGLVAAVLWLARDRVFPPQPMQTAAQLNPSAPGAAQPAAPTPAPPAGALQTVTPSFDVVRLNPQGDTVIAGRAAPNSEISIRDGDTEIGHARADSNGEWVVLPDKPLAPGKHDLSIEARGGGTVATSQNKVTFDVPEPKRAGPEVAVAGASSQPSVSAAAAPGAITVQRGGTLWGIARDSLGSGTRFTTIYAANRDSISNPDLIYPGQVVKLPAAR